MILESYERMFKEKPRKSRPPLEGGDHPELDTSELCDDHQTKQFQTLIGQLQWLISLGRFDIAVHVMLLSRFRAQPRKGHLDRAKRIVGYLLFLPDGAIRFRTGEPDFSSLKDQEYDWTRSVYSGACEQIPHDIPKPLGKHVQTTHYVDANLHHDLTTGKAVTAVLHFLNQTPIDAYTKRQSTVETATYGSEFVAARTAVDQIIDIRTTLRYLGVPIKQTLATSIMLSDGIPYSLKTINTFRSMKNQMDPFSYLKSNTIKQRMRLKIYMTLLTSQDRPDDQKYNPNPSIPFWVNNCSN